MKTRANLAGYLEEITGQEPAIQEAAVGDTEKLPLFLRSAYRLLEVHLFHHRFVLAQEQADQEHATPLEYAGHVDLLHSLVGIDVALVLTHVPTHVRNRLVHQGVPFIVPGRQMFLPFLAVDLREHDPRLFRGQRDVLSGASQVTLLGHLLGKPVEGRPLGEVAVTFGYSAMTLSKVADELEAKGLCEVVREGRTRRIGFGPSKRELWERALPHLENPVRARRWVRRWVTNQTVRLVAGTTALERHTLITDDRVPTFAVWQKEYRASVERGDIVGCEGPDEAECRAECWAYDPARLAEGDCVDRFSLYLSLKDTRDERIRKELKAMMEGVEW